MSSWTLLDIASRGRLTTGLDANPWRSAWVDLAEGSPVEADAVVVVALWEVGLLELGPPLAVPPDRERKWLLTGVGQVAYRLGRRRDGMPPGEVPPVGGPYS